MCSLTRTTTHHCVHWKRHIKTQNPQERLHVGVERRLIANHRHYTFTKAGIPSFMQSAVVGTSERGPPGHEWEDIRREDLLDAARFQGMTERTVLGQLNGKSTLHSESEFECESASEQNRTTTRDQSYSLRATCSEGRFPSTMVCLFIKPQ